MKIFVDEQMKRFWLAINHKGWVGVYGFEIQIDEYRFSVVGMDGKLILSEVSSGVHVAALELPEELHDILYTKERLLGFFQKVIAHVLIDLIETTTFTTQFATMREEMFELYGEMPPIENVDEDLLFAKDSEILN